MEVEHCIRVDGEGIRNFLHQIKKTVEKGWPDDMTRVLLADQMLNAPHKLGKEDNDTLITHQKDSDQDTYNEILKNF